MLAIFTDKWSKILGMFVVVVLVLALRYEYTWLASWGEDQASNLWLGRHLFQSFPKVGLMSSIGLYNPNGMLLFGNLLSYLGGLKNITECLSIFQLLGAALLCFSMRSEIGAGLSVLMFLVMGTSPLMAAMGVEFWNQWILASFNLMYIGLSFYFLKTSKVYVVWFAVLPLFCSLYLGGALNVMLFLLLLGVEFFFYKNSREYFLAALTKKNVLLFVFIGTIMFLFVWKPYFSVVSWKNVSHSTGSFGWKRWKGILDAFASAPRMLWLYTQFSFGSNLWFSDVLSEQAVLFEKIAAFSSKILLGTSVAMLGGSLVSRRKIFFKKYRENLFFRMLLGAAAIPILIAPMSMLIGGPQYHRADRVDQLFSFMPFFLILIVVLPWELLKLFNKSVYRKIIEGFFLSNLVVMITFNFFASHEAAQDFLGFRGNQIYGANVPLSNKLEALKFVVELHKIKRPGEQRVRLDYDFLTPDLVNEDEFYLFAEKVSIVHGAVFTPGRALDDELESQYSLRNYQEGVLRRKRGAGDFIMGYARLASKNRYLATEWETRDFGRVRVWIRKNHI